MLAIFVFSLAIVEHIFYTGMVTTIRQRLDSRMLAIFVFSLAIVEHIFYTGMAVKF